MSKGLQIALGALAVCALLGWAARDALSEDGALAGFAYYQTLGEFAASEPGARARVHGYVAIGSVERDVPGRQVRFLLQQTPPHAARARVDGIAMGEFGARDGDDGNTVGTGVTGNTVDTGTAVTDTRDADAGVTVGTGTDNTAVNGNAVGTSNTGVTAARDAVTATPLPIIYTSLETPDLFRGGAEVVVEGRRAHAGAPFIASNLLAKCPSKFEAAATATNATANAATAVTVTAANDAVATVNAPTATNISRGPAAKR